MPRTGTSPGSRGRCSGLQAAVIALVAQALLRIGRRALRTPLHVALAVASFVALAGPACRFRGCCSSPRPAGALTPRDAPRPTRHTTQAANAHSALRTLAVGSVLWVAPLVLLAATLGLDSIWSRAYLFFTQAALVTFGGAYAVLGYVTTELVANLGWVTAAQSVAGLALAETTPGPLVIVLQFLGFMAGWNHHAPLAPLGSALLASALASWATFLPSFVFIFLGAPHLERLTHDARIATALAAITRRGGRGHRDTGAVAGTGRAVAARLGGRVQLERARDRRRDLVRTRACTLAAAAGTRCGGSRRLAAGQPVTTAELRVFGIPGGAVPSVDRPDRAPDRRPQR